MTAWQPGGTPPSWQPTPPSAQQQQWGAPYQRSEPAQPQAGPTYPQGGPPVPGEPRPPWPLPPASVWTAAGAAVATVVLLIVMTAAGGVTDVAVALGLRREDASVLAGLLATMAIGGLLGGAAGVLTGRGRGLLGTVAGAVGLLALLAVVGSAIAQQRIDWAEPVFGALVLAGAALATGSALTASARAWTTSTERRSAERAIARLSASSRRPAAVSGRGVGSLLVSLVLVLGTVLAGVLVSTSLAPETVASGGSSGSDPGSASDAGRLPVAPGDAEYSSYQDELARDCAAGDLSSCDELFYQSERFGSYAAYGSTCGARTDENYAGSCDDLYHD
jgi:hypothetical protein